jgi:hypothetical protein
MSRNLNRICGQIEYSPDPFDDVQQAIVLRQIYAHEQGWLGLFRPDVNGACCAADLDRSSIELLSNYFHSGSCPLSKESDHRGPVEGGAIREPNQEAFLARYGPELTAQAAELAWRMPASRPHGMIELPYALESGGEGDLGNGQLGLIDQVASKMNSMGSRDFDRRCT